jgi:Family of unknown function (DUF5706)
MDDKPMHDKPTELVERQLDRVLLFFGRVESKTSFLLATNASLLAVMLLNLDYSDISKWYIATPLVLALILNSDSLFHVYRATHPSLEGGAGSYVYFAEISARPEQVFVEGFLAQDIEEYKKDLLRQVWRNSQILSQKFSDVKRASSSLIFSLLPWVIFLMASSVQHSRVIQLK